MIRGPRLALLLLLAGLALAVVGLMTALAWGYARTLPIATLAAHAPKETALMRQRAREARAGGRTYRADRRWVPYASIAPTLRRAVLVAEDDAFFAHGGLDWNELKASARTNLEKRRVVRGGSTITQQLAKNLYLGDARTPTRKLGEVFVALRLERELSKRRIFELYLNSIEWGDGIYGIEAAARRHFGVSASRLDARQSVLLAAVIINPRKYSPVRPGPRILKRVRMIAGRLARRGHLDDREYRIAIGAAPEPGRSSITDGFPGGSDTTDEAADTTGIAAPAGPVAPPLPEAPGAPGGPDTL